MTNFLDISIEQALISSLIIGKKNSYASSNPLESKFVFNYLKGGSRPIKVITPMGKHLVALEDARRAGYQPPINTFTYNYGTYSSEIYSE